MDVLFQLQGVEFEWDEDKAHANVRKHGVTFEEAAEVFFDPLAVFGDATDNFEQRDFTLGYTIALRLLLVVHVERRSRMRIISARQATRSERQSYEEG